MNRTDIYQLEKLCFLLLRMCDVVLTRSLLLSVPLDRRLYGAVQRSQLIEI